MSLSDANLADYFLGVLRGGVEGLGLDDGDPIGPDARFADVFDSMAMVEFLGIVAEDCRCEISAIEEAVDQHFSTVAHLARSMQRAGLGPREPAIDQSAGATRFASVG